MQKPPRAEAAGISFEPGSSGLEEPVGWGHMVGNAQRDTKP